MATHNIRLPPTLLHQIRKSINLGGWRQALNVRRHFIVQNKIKDYEI